MSVLCKKNLQDITNLFAPVSVKEIQLYLVIRKYVQ